MPEGWGQAHSEESEDRKRFGRETSARGPGEEGTAGRRVPNQSRGRKMRFADIRQIYQERTRARFAFATKEVAELTRLFDYESFFASRRKRISSA